jgi:hypothetical protein
MFKDLDLSGLRRMPEIAFYFRYPLHHADFREVRDEGRLLGRYASKQLYGRLTPQGKVDRSAGNNCSWPSSSCPPGPEASELRGYCWPASPWTA